MKLYHYAPKENTCLEKGLLSVSVCPENLQRYACRINSKDPALITQWLESTFPGRSRSISCFTEPLKVNGKIILNKGHLFSFDIDKLVHDGLVESIYCKIKSGKGGCTEKFQKVKASEIDYTPLDFTPYKTEKEITNAFFKHYMVVLKKGFIPPNYLTLEGEYL